MINLTRLCADAGLRGSDADTAIRAYVRKVPLTARDAADLAERSATERSAILTARYGSDGARVATIVMASR